MNIRKNKGYVMADITIAVIILLILVPVIMGLVYNIEVNKRGTEAKSEAINIAVNALEAAKGIDISTLDVENIFQNMIENVYKDGKMIEKEKNENGQIVKYGVINLEKGNYELYLTVIDYGDDESHNAEKNKVKTVTAIVKYKSSGKNQEINLSTVLK